MQPNSSTDPAEIAKFEKMASEWWNPHGSFRPLHMLNPCRLGYINSQIETEFDRDLRDNLPFTGLKIVDIGCGGGLLSEPMARLGATVTGIDAAERNIPIAQSHAKCSRLEIEYLHATAGQLVSDGRKFDVVLNMEVVEHVPEPLTFLVDCQRLMNPGGLMVCSTINRNPKSFVMAIVGAEYVLGWLPKGTHDWGKFLKPEELSGLLQAAEFEPVDVKGFVFNPFRWEWKVSASDFSVNYVTASVKPVVSGN